MAWTAALPCAPSMGISQPAQALKVIDPLTSQVHQKPRPRQSLLPSALPRALPSALAVAGGFQVGRLMS